MPVKPQFQISLMLLAMVLGAGLSYGILRTMPDEPKPVAVKAAEVFQLPEAYFYNEAGEKTRLNDFRGQVLLVNLWATWCPPCVVELPALDTLQAKLKDKNFRVVAISLDRTSATNVISFLKGRGIEQLNVYWDKDRQIPAKWQYSGIPTTFLVDAAGNVVETFDGPYEWDRGPVFEKISSFVK